MTSNATLIAILVLTAGFAASTAIAQNQSSQTAPVPQMPMTNPNSMAGGMGMMNDPEMRAQMMRMMESCNRMMENMTRPASTAPSAPPPAR